ncbi:MAG TPA: GrpB family protein [Actinocrinis sp.]
MAVDIAVAVGDPAPVEFASYDKAWPDRFARCARLLHNALGECAVRVDHIGSTAVPGLPGRPQLDIQVSVAEPEAEEEYRGALEQLGFTLWVREADHRVFRAGAGVLRVPPIRFETRLYVCRSGGVLEYDQLLLVQYLTNDAGQRDRYAALKRGLAREFRNDPDGYADRKRLFLREIARQAHRGHVAVYGMDGMESWPA